MQESKSRVTSGTAETSLGSLRLLQPLKPEQKVIENGVLGGFLSTRSCQS